MQKSIVVMPTLKRTEMLALALQKLAQLSGSEDLPVQIFLDTCTQEKTDEVEFVRDEYFPTAQILQAKEHVKAPSGCWNILHAIKSGYETGAEFVFLIEEDVMVYPDYFDWHFAIHENYFNPAHLLATCGRRKKEYKTEFYTNPGSCLHRNLLDYIVPHINDDFFQNRIKYLNERFGSIEDCGDLDDGLIRRVIDKVQAEIIYPDCPVVAHQGFWAYQKLVEYKTHGSIQERVEQLRNMLPTLNPKDRYLKDFEPYRWSRQRMPNGTTGKAA
jgi:hypothetical protein